MSRKVTKIILSIVLLATSYGFILYKIIKFEELKELNLRYLFQSKFNYLIILAVLLLMIINLSTEAFKWKILIDKIQKITFYKSLKAVCSGITVGIFTPNRIGEIGGRLLFLKKGNRTYGLLATSLAGFSQFITTIITGLIGFSLFLFLYPEKTSINPIFNKVSAVIIFIVLLALVWIFYNSNLIRPLLLKFSFFKSRINQLNYFTEAKALILSKILFLSIGRYFIFLSQFILLLIFFDIHLTLMQAYISISLIYLFLTLIPTTTLVELGIRGSLAIFFIGIFSENIIGIVLSTTFLWIINLAIPSVIGSLFFAKNNL